MRRQESCGVEVPGVEGEEVQSEGGWIASGTTCRRDNWQGAQDLAKWRRLIRPHAHTSWKRCGRRRIWKDRGIKLAIKVKLVKAFCVPYSLLYGAETWTMRKVEKNKSDALEVWC